MSFVVRGVEHEDLSQVFSLTQQFILLNLPSDKKILTEKIERSIASFDGRLPMEECEFLFVVEDVDNQFIAGSSQIISKHGTESCPHLYFQVLQKNRMSEELGVGFMHKILRFQQDYDGPTEIGGLIVDKAYRRRPEKVGRQVSLMRFLYMASNLDKFTDRVLCEFAPPLTDEGRSEFWEALGRRFTGMPYQEADQLSQLNKEFIQQLFPEEDIYTSLLDSKARLVMGQVGEKTRPAQALLEKIGFRYLEKIDPFDGGPHYGAKTEEISIVRDTKLFEARPTTGELFDKKALVGCSTNGKFRGIQTAVSVNEDEELVLLPEKIFKNLKIESGEKVYLSLMK